MSDDEVTVVLPGKAIDVLFQTGWFDWAGWAGRHERFVAAPRRKVGRGYQYTMTLTRSEAGAMADHFRRVLVETPSTRRVWHVAARRSIAVITQALAK